jgi:hypothetical protein
MGPTNFGSLVDSLLEWGFCPPLSKLRIGSLIVSVAGVALSGKLFGTLRRFRVVI